MTEIWLIEDNADLREATATALSLESAAYCPKGFGSCEDALAAAEQGGRADVILLDVGLPGMDGIEGIKRFKAAMPDAIIVILTVFKDDDKIFRAVCAGASGYLLKSGPIQNVIQAIEEALAGGAPMSPKVATRVLAMFSKLAPAKTDYGLSPREQSVLEQMVNGFPKKQIADQLELSLHTVDTYVRGIYKKLHVNCQTAAVSVAVRNGLVPGSR